MIIKKINGKYYYNKELKKLKKIITFFNKNYLKNLFLSIIVIGDNYATNTYIKKKIDVCNYSNSYFVLLKFSRNIITTTIMKIINILNNNKYITGILIQCPLPKKLNKLLIFKKISQSKDVDFLNFTNLNSHLYGIKNIIYPCTVTTILFFLKKLKINIKNVKFSIFGFSNIVGKPLSLKLISLGANVNIISKHDKKYFKLLKDSDIIITAVGKNKFISCEDVPFGSIILDVGINKVKNKLYGDFKSDHMLKNISWVTPVPGGIGPITVINLLKNLYLLSCYNFNVHDLT